MGLFSAASDQRSSPQHSVDYTSEAPNRNNRTHCWEARDEYFRCLDRNGIIDSVRDKSNAAKKCPQESQEFDAKCASSWVRNMTVPHSIFA